MNGEMKCVTPHEAPSYESKREPMAKQLSVIDGLTEKTLFRAASIRATLVPVDSQEMPSRPIANIGDLIEGIYDKLMLLDDVLSQIAGELGCR